MLAGITLTGYVRRTVFGPVPLIEKSCKKMRVSEKCCNNSSDNPSTNQMMSQSRSRRRLNQAKSSKRLNGVVARIPTTYSNILLELYGWLYIPIQVYVVERTDIFRQLLAALKMLDWA